MKLPAKIQFVNKNLKNEFGKLSDKDFIQKFLLIAFIHIQENAFCGIQIPKQLIPKEYKQKYDLKNLWKYNLPNGWRLLYSITRDEILVIAIIIEWMDHKDYEKKLKY